MMKKISGMMFFLTAIILLAGRVGATVPSTAVSDDVLLDTRTLSRGVAAEDKSLDSRSYTVDWSEAAMLNTKPIISTLILIR